MQLIDKLLETAKPYFQEFKKLSVNCPKCKSQMVLKFASNPEKHGRKLSIILCCSKDCDRKIWNRKVEEKEFTHWWLDGKRNLEGYEKIVNSLPKEEREFIKRLKNEIVLFNYSK